MVRSLYRFHVFYHMRGVLKRLQVPLPYKSGFNAANNPYSIEGFFKLCEDYGVPHNPEREVLWNPVWGLVGLHRFNDALDH